MYHKMSFIGVPPEVVRLASNRRGSLDPKTATEHSMGVEEEEQHYGQRPMYQLIPAAVHNTENRVETQPEAAVKYPVEHVMRIAAPSNEENSMQLPQSVLRPIQEDRNELDSNEIADDPSRPINFPPRRRRRYQGSTDLPVTLPKRRRKSRS
eukprot:Seg460.18 transcript_id=Seg460.18/GoldUCD/mRNA.D3Y31 product="hypothetical protein" protein_id=Seg460.18/GoldUCD/D3Y31